MLQLILDIGRDYGLRALRVPHEPLWFAARAAPVAGAASAALLAPWVARMRRVLRSRGIAHNDRVFGIARSGNMDAPALLGILARLPAGVSEIYLHPATETALTPAMAHYRHTDELAGLLSAQVRHALEGSGALRGGYLDLIGGPAREGP